jgi:WD40 repeat protein
MARIRRYFIVRLIALVALGCATPALAQDAAEAAPASLYDRPTLVLDPGMHTAVITRADVDAAGRYAVTGSFDKTVRVWSIADGRPLRPIRLPAGPSGVGRVYAVAISPEGDVIAAGGWTRGGNKDDQIYLFARASGAPIKPIDGLPNAVLHLIFSPDGRHLAATLGGANGLRVYDRHAGWAEVARDPDYADHSYGADFSAGRRLATTSNDGHVRLYDRKFELIAEAEATGGRYPYGIAFSPEGAKLAVGYADTTTVKLLDGRTLAPLPGPDTSDIDDGNLNSVI